MVKIASLAAALVLVASIGAAKAGELTAAKVTEMQEAWGDGIVKIGSIYTAGGDYKAAAKEHLEAFYAYGQEDVLFKPTLAAADQFRGTFDEALSYFVGGVVSEDKGFAIAPYTKVRWENEGTILQGDSAVAMGNYFFTKTDGAEVKVEYTFGIEKMDDGSFKFVLHHSSLPYQPG
ncbi:MAG: phosphoribosyl-AMP cyclohydrolase [Pseudomonadota bacterium]